LNRRSLIVAGIVGFVALAALTYWYRHRLTTAVAINPTSSASQLQPARPPAAQARLPEGSPAIKPSTSGMPSYSIDEVKRFVLAHPIGARNDKSGAVTIKRAEFMSSRDVSAILDGARTGFADDYMLCYVELSGNFTFPGPQNVTRTYQRGFEIFDAQTGNFLMVGGLRN
jgi:hypothetical protein